MKEEHEMDLKGFLSSIWLQGFNHEVGEKDMDFSSGIVINGPYPKNVIKQASNFDVLISQSGPSGFDIGDTPHAERVIRFMTDRGKVKLRTVIDCMKIMRTHFSDIPPIFYVQ